MNTKDEDVLKKLALDFYQKYNHLTYLLVYVLLYLWFLGLEHVTKPVYYMHCTLDDMVPFMPVFVVPYLLWFAYVGGTVAFFAIVSKADYYRLLHFIYWGFGICLFLYMLFPNAQHLRPHALGHDIFSNIVRIIYRDDTPTNVAPSIHVVLSIGTHIALSQYARLRRNWAVYYGSFVMMVTICLSTVFIKQHSVMDGLLGALLAFILYVFVYRHDRIPAMGELGRGVIREINP